MPPVRADRGRTRTLRVIEPFFAKVQETARDSAAERLSVFLGRARRHSARSFTEIARATSARLSAIAFESGYREPGCGEDDCRANNRSILLSRAVEVAVAAAPALEQLEILAKIPTAATYGDPRYNRCWDSLRGDPRFDKIVAAAKAASK